MFDWHKANPKIQYQCPWCGLDRRQGVHAIEEDRPDGGVNILYKVVMDTHHPAKIGRIDG